MTTAAPPRLLLVEDDAVSAAFLRDALAALPADVQWASSLAQADRCATAASHALWLVDANLPDGPAEDWLAARRASGDVTPALALTAEIRRERFDSLESAGFREVLQKPLSVAALQAAARRALGIPAPSRWAVSDKLPVWDQASALAALGGNHEALGKLRELFLGELPGQCDSILAALAVGDRTAARNVLHRLQAGAGFVGAARLLLAARGLSASIDDGEAARAFADAVSDQLAVPASPPGAA